MNTLFKFILLQIKQGIIELLKFLLLLVVIVAMALIVVGISIVVGLFMWTISLGGISCLFSTMHWAELGGIGFITMVLCYLLTTVILELDKTIRSVKRDYNSFKKYGRIDS